MGNPDQKPHLFYEARSEYDQLRKQAEDYLSQNFLNAKELRKSEESMIRSLKTEYQRLIFLKFFKTNLERETLNLIRFFFLRERREDVRIRDYSVYLLGFMKKNRQKMVKPWKPPVDPTFDDVVAEMVSRINPPWDDPCPVLTEWIPFKLKAAAEVIPLEILKNGGIGKIFRVISGVFLYTLTDFESNTPIDEAKSRINLALKCGYYFGLLHPLVDDILDSANHLSGADKREVLELMDHWVGGDFDRTSELENIKPVKAIKIALFELYELYAPYDRAELIKISYFLHFAQMDDLQKVTSSRYPLNSIYVPVLMKAAFTRIISCWFSGTRVTPELTNDILETGLVFQMMDDFRDIVADLKEDSFTPFTNYLNCGVEKPMNPWLIYLHAMEIFIKKSPNQSVSRNSLLRRVAISIQNYAPNDNDGKSLEYLKVILSESPGSFKYVKKILGMRVGIIDPDKSLFEPIDQYFKSL